MEVLSVLTACILLAFFSKLGQGCGPAEIGQQYNIISTANVPSSATVIWRLSNGTTLYDSTRSVPNKYPDVYDGSRTQLTIVSVTKDDGSVPYQHIVDSTAVYQCKLPIYKRASIPACENVVINGNKIRTTCTTAEVYPQAKCQFTLQNEGLDSRDVTDGTFYITYNHTDPQTEGNEYYSTSCELQYPVDGLKPGEWTVQVTMYPDLTGVSSDQGTTGQAENTLQLSLPTVTIYPITCPKGLAGDGDTNVRNGYIRQGERASCLCTRAHAGNPPGTVGWSSTHGGNFDILSLDEDASIIQINSSDTFTCESSSVLDGSHSATYTPKYAYGPISASLTLQHPGPIYLCANQQTNIDITCQVPENSFNPATLFTIRDSHSKNLVTKVAGDDVWYKSVSYNFTTSGQHTFTCRAENAIFGDMFTEAPASPVQVYAPPDSPPSFKVSGRSVSTVNSETWVKVGSDISVSCLAIDAYPLINSVNITCGEKTSSSGQIFVDGMSGNELICQCAVDHVTNTPCKGFNLNKEITLHTAYGPNDASITFHHPGPIYLCPNQQTNIDITCQVPINSFKPATLFTIRDRYRNYLVLEASGNTTWSLTVNYNFSTSGEHEFTCRVTNSIFRSILYRQAYKTIQVYEPPRDPPMMNSFVLKDEVLVSCSVFRGYPSVHFVNLTCGQNHHRYSNITTAVLHLKKVDLSYKQINCTCQATHVTGCYDLIGVLVLPAIVSNSTQSDPPPIGAIVVGVTIGAFVVIAVVVVGVVFYFRRVKALEEIRNSDPRFRIRVWELYVPRPKDDNNFQPTLTSARAIPENNNNPDSQASNPGLSDNVTSEGPAGPPHYSSTSYDGIDLDDP